jgi:hypothetical protein
MLPVLVVAIAVTVMLYVPGVAFVVVGVVEPLEELLELLPQPIAPRAATERTAARSAPQRRRRGRRNMRPQARVAPVLAAYQGIRLIGVDGRCVEASLRRPVAPVVLVW